MSSDLDGWIARGMTYRWNFTLKHQTVPRIPWCVYGHNTVLATMSLISSSEFWRNEVLQIAVPSPPASGSHPCILWLLFSITANKRHYYYDSIPCVWWWVAIFSLNHAIAVINFLSALVPTTRCSRLPERLIAHRERWKEKKKQKIKQHEGKTEIGGCVFDDGSRDSLLFTVTSGSEWVFLNTILCQNKKVKRRSGKGIRLRVFCILCHAGFMFHSTSGN